VPFDYHARIADETTHIGKEVYGLLTLNATRTTPSCSHRRQNKTHWKKKLQLLTLTAIQYNTLQHYHVRTADKTKETGKEKQITASDSWAIKVIQPRLNTVTHCNALQHTATNLQLLTLGLSNRFEQEICHPRFQNHQ